MENRISSLSFPRGAQARYTGQLRRWDGFVAPSCKINANVSISKILRFLADLFEANKFERFG